ncbi:MAG TPA: M2 family metallopeptidase [Chthonomonadaceae bacterium]|nr:M2 family metallopeptidase [Chthonomonadaceae bacterium]
MSQDSVLQAFIDRHLAIVEPLEREVALAEWELQTTSSPEARDRSQELSARRAKIYANPQEYAFLKGLSPNAFDTPRLARQRELLVNAYLANQIEEATIEEMIALEIEIADAFNVFRATVQGKPVSDNEIDDLLIESNDSALRREAWEASKRVGAEVAERVLKLARLRNREARRLGFDNYYAMGLTLQELDEARLFALLDDLKHQSDPLWQTYKSDLDAQLAARFGISQEEVQPWHYANRFFQEPGPGEADLDRFFADKDLEALTATFFSAIGLPVDDLLQNSDLYERPGKCQHAFCMDIDRKGDVRVLCNNRPNERWMSTMLHEFGHAVYDKFTDPEMPFLLREPAHTLATEAIALFMGRLTKDAAWLKRYAGVAEAEADGISLAARQEIRDHLLVFTRWCLVMAHFERELYRDPDQDLNTVWWRLVEEFQGVKRPEGRYAPDWAAKIHLATAPVYYHNYLLGEMVASQLLHTLRTTVLPGEGPDALIESPGVGRYLITEVFRPGALRPWEGWLHHATGEPLNPAYFVAQLENA